MKLLTSFLACAIAIECGCTALADEFAVTSRLHSVLAPRTAIDLCGAWEWRQVPHPRYARRGKGPEWRVVSVPWNAVMKNDFRTIEHYRRRVSVPPFAGKRAELHFDGLPGTTTIRLNGRLVATNWYPIACAYDVTDYLVPGENELYLEMSMFDIPPLYKSRQSVRPGDPSYVLAGAFGLNRPLWLEFHDPVAVADATVRTFVEPKQVLTAEVVLTNGTDRIRRVNLIASVPDWSRSCVVDLPPLMSRTVAITNVWPEAKLWTPDAPHLQLIELAVVENGQRLDATRVRFGFREIRTEGERLLLNGRPMMVRRIHGGGAPLPDDAHQAETVRRLKSRGLNGIRTEIVNVSRWVNVADEEGFLISTFAECLTKGRNATDEWWRNKQEFDALLYGAYKNSPGIVCWGISNEFGSFYGLGGTNDEAVVHKQQEIGRHYAELDSTRPWTAYGDVEVGWPVRGPGPAPIRSFHYPKRPTSDSECLPEAAWWYARRELSFQGISDGTKPLSISEDFYHGLTDQFFGASKWAGDAIYTPEGYWKAWYDCVRMYADGYYEAGVACWNVWATADHSPTNRLFELYGPMMPEALIALRETFANVRSGTREKRTLAVYNRGFSLRNGTLVRRMVLGGKVVDELRRGLRLDPGGDWRAEETLAFPVVSKPTLIRVSYEWMVDGLRFATRNYDFTVFPRENVRMKECVAVLADAGDVAANWSAAFVSGDIAAVTNAGLPIVIAGRKLTRGEGRALRAFVRGGGRVLLAEMPSDGWVPARLETGRPQSFVWRRSDEALEGVTDAMLRIWRPDTRLGDSGYTKMPKVAAEILADSGHAQGLCAAQIERLYEGRGHWFLLQLPVVSRLSDEPCAAFVLNAALAEFARGKEKSMRLYCSAEDPFAALAEHLGIAATVATNGPGTNAVWVRTCADVPKLEDGRSFIQFVKHGGTGVLLDAGTESAAFLARLGIVASSAAEVGWAVRRGNDGVMSGISNEELFLVNEKPSLRYWSPDLKGMRPPADRVKKLSTYPMFRSVLSVAGGADGIVHTDPGVLVEVRFGKGRMVVLSIDTKKALAHFSSKTERLLRTLFLNLGALSSPLVQDTYFDPVDLGKYANRGLWQDPAHPDVEGWFDDGNDMRYFPVNLCGWSPDSNNHCPKGEFPRSPVSYGGVPFLIPYVKAGSSGYGGAVVLRPGERVKCGFRAYGITAFHFLGAAATGERPPKNGAMPPSPLITATWAGEYGGVRRHAAKAEFFCGDHLNGYRWAQSVKSGRVAWVGPTRLDHDAVLYAWSAVNTLARHQIVTELVLENTGTVPVAIVGLTVEKLQD